MNVLLCSESSVILGQMDMSAVPEKASSLCLVLMQLCQ